jgi:hypothetical protein
MRDAFMVTICLILAVAAIPVLFCVGYVLFVGGGRVFEAALDSLEALADMGLDAGERIVEKIDKAVSRK